MRTPDSDPTYDVGAPLPKPRGWIIAPLVLGFIALLFIPVFLAVGTSLVSADSPAVPLVAVVVAAFVGLVLWKIFAGFFAHTYHLSQTHLTEKKWGRVTHALPWAHLRQVDIKVTRTANGPVREFMLTGPNSHGLEATVVVKPGIVGNPAPLAHRLQWEVQQRGWLVPYDRRELFDDVVRESLARV